MINADPWRIRQVLDNLLENATRYSPKGTEITMAVRRRQKREVIISVSDRGEGIPKNELPRIFDRMYRIEKRLTTAGQGLGLGLSICKGLVEAHGGRIWAESEPGRGSTFFFTLPLSSEGDSNV